MKRLHVLIMAAVAAGFLAFAFSYWLMQMEYGLALSTGMGAGAAGFAVELLQPLWQKKDADGKISSTKVDK